MRVLLARWVLWFLVFMGIWMVLATMTADPRAVIGVLFVLGLVLDRELWR